MLEVLQLLGVGDRTAVQQLLIMLRSSAHLVHVSIGTILIALEVIGDDLGCHELIASAREAGIETDQGGSLRKGGRAMRELREPSVLLLEIEKAPLVLRFGVHDVLPRCAAHGSVGVVETTVRTVPPITEAACCSQGHSLAQ